MAAVLDLGAAASFGLADFLGGLTSRQADSVRVTAIAQLSGLLVLAAVLPLLPGTVSVAALGWGALAGVGGAMGLAAYFRALAIGPMGVTAPVTALVGVGVPVLVGLAGGERPDALAVVGILLGLVAVVLVSRPATSPHASAEAHDPARLRQGLAWATVGGLAFGWFFIGLDLTPGESGMWPLLGARVAGLTALGILIAARRAAATPRRAVGIAAVSGLADMLANALFLLAVRQGLLVLVSVLTSLYPVGVVLLARAVLGERLGRQQAVGIGLALTATALIAV